MIPAAVSLAFSVASRKGVYAVLLGSGVSTGAGVPTGYGVTLDLISRLATQAGEADIAEADPERWFTNKYGEAPAYSKLVSELGRTSADRQHLLRGYFEPTPEEREEGLKVPSTAHRSIARLVAAGFVRVIVTTNFDRLTEIAIQDEGISPVVISGEGAARGAEPLAHRDCTVIKVNGDYLDANLRNTPAELSKYAEHMNELLLRVFDEHGLLVCGWSVSWDSALKDLLKSTRGRRYGAYWALKGPPTEEAKDVIAYLNAETIEIDTADDLLRSLADSVLEIEATLRVHPALPALATSKLKRYLGDTRYHIHAHDLLADETRETRHRLERLLADTRDLPARGGDLRDTVRRYDAAIETLQSLVVAGTRWGGLTHLGALGRAVLVSAPVLGDVCSLRTLGERLGLYPGLVLLYSSAMAAALTDNAYALKHMLLVLKYEDNGEEQSALQALRGDTWLSDGEGWAMPGMETRHIAALSIYMRGKLRPLFLDELPTEREYNRCFNRLEYLMSLASGFSSWRDAATHASFLPGLYPLDNSARQAKALMASVTRELEQEGSDWSYFQAGLFDIAGEEGVRRFATFKRMHDRRALDWASDWNSSAEQRLPD